MAYYITLLDILHKQAKVKRPISQIDYAIEVIIIFCYKEKLQKEKESYTEKVHAKGKRFENIFKKLYFS